MAEHSQTAERPEFTGKGIKRAPERYRAEKQPNHPGRWLVIGPSGKDDGWSYPSEGAALHACYISDDAYAEGVKNG
jgi:hypothetical protein